jgi:hypothetical protein
MDSITLTFTHRNDTKGTRRYDEQVEDGQDAVIGSLYVKKHANTPDTLTVTISDGAKPTARKRTSK